ncbi:hypothetical protein AAG570_008727 [Ranatra chinensis]|uniref:Dynein heavy chain n=1 Tax=Ranatra chinensis TaxID=642074 RepID=A0ABD0YRQ4_9HEMI
MSPSGSPFEAVYTYVLNPKSITMGQLYGEFDLLTDGILPSMVRIGASAEDLNKRWYVFDGPVDAVWIENMNTVLDDNKKLCLTSGEIIKLTSSMTLMFEVADLAVASPATVSRCGMVYIEPSVLGLLPFINCWIRRLPKLAKGHGEAFQELFSRYLLPGVELLRSRLKEIVASVDSAIVLSFLKLLDSFLAPLTMKDNRPPPSAKFLKLMPQLIPIWVIFSLVWSVGATCNANSQAIFSNWLIEIMTANNEEPPFPQNSQAYDYRFHDGGFTMATPSGEPEPPMWVHWMTGVPEYRILIDSKYSDIEVPTINSVRNAELLGMLLINENNVLCVGPTGTGKTLTDLIDSKLDKRRRGVYGPPVLKRLALFIDDFNMPALEVYGAQPPIELIRQWMDFGGWYDRQNIGDFRTLIDLNFVAAMGPPGGGRNPITPRLLRHFHFLAFTEMDDDCKVGAKMIFSTILGSWLTHTSLPEDYVDYTLKASLNVYSTVIKELLPTPAKTHYTFNLRDLSKVFQGIFMTVPEDVPTFIVYLHLWFHENCRVFEDRMVNDKDRAWFQALLHRQMVEDFHVEPNQVLSQEPILFADFIQPDFRRYSMVTDLHTMLNVLNNYLAEYNATSTAPMNLVLFYDAMSHISRICRIIRQPQGNALLLGMGGSGA